MKVPNAENATIDIRKLRDYCLNLDHKDGKHKARLFRSQLGITDQDADRLRLILFEIVQTHAAQVGRRDRFGQRYTVDFELIWQNKRAIVRSGWIIEHGSNIPKLTTCYPV
ncbi:hypothetical protein NIES970_16190 [[Synechococcus] sp. NIES-970]|nr:hypothetical protein NIES970_16190 [[Synechococcus] sp. NIES-970]